MKGRFFFFKVFSVFFLIFSSCSDDFCFDPVTPKFIIRFYDKMNPIQSKKVNLKLWSTGKKNLYNGQSVDSIAIPLDIRNSSTVYHFSNQKNAVENITIHYKIHDVFVSKFCGFKSVFKNIKILSDKNIWISNIEILKKNIVNESQVHVKIYH